VTAVNIAHIVYSFGIGGMENGIVNLANHIDSRKFRLRIYSLRNEAESLARIKNQSVPFSYFPKRKGNDLTLPFRLAKAIKSDDVDVVHTHGWGTFLEGLMAARLAGAKAVIHGEHGIFLLDKQRRKTTYKIFSRLVDQFLTVNEHLRQLLVGQFAIPGNKVRAIHNGVDTEHFCHIERLGNRLRDQLALPKETVLIGTVGRFCIEKDYATLLDAFALLVKKTPEVVLLLVGDGPLRCELEAKAESLNLSKKVIFFGASDDIPGLLNSMDVFVLTSTHEGLPNTILEAMSVGLPVVATRVGGIPEAVLDGETGLLVEPGNPVEISAALGKIILSVSLRETLARAGHLRVRSKFSLARMVKGYEDAYAQCLVSKGLKDP